MAIDSTGHAHQPAEHAVMDEAADHGMQPEDQGQAQPQHDVIVDVHMHSPDTDGTEQPAEGMA